MNINKGTCLAVLLIMLTSFGCRDKCQRLECVNGSCVEGVCACSDGYEGGLCETPVSEKFDGTYAVDEDCTAGFDNYDLRIIPNASVPEQIRITGLWEKNDTITGTIDATGVSFNIERQSLGNVQVTGSGTSDPFGNSIALDYQIYNTGAGSPFDVCSAELSKN